jgi:CBS domain-containing protein
MNTARPARPACQPVSRLPAERREALRRDLARHAPFAQMSAEHLEQTLRDAELATYRPDERVLGPDSGPVTHLQCVLSGSITGRRGLADAAGGFVYEAGDLFPVGAAVGQRPVTASYTADDHTVCLLLPVDAMHRLASASTVFADFLNRRVMQLLELSQKAVQASFASQALAQQSLESNLGALVRKPPVVVTPQTRLSEALALMKEGRIGSVLVAESACAPHGILTRHDVLERITLPQLALSTPIEQVMSQPLHSLSTADTVQDAALLMSRHGIRHLPVTEGGVVVNMVSERDLFALQRLSLSHVGTNIRQAPDLPAVAAAAADIRRLARSLLGQGVQARQLTELISHLNDLVAERLVDLVAAKHGLDMQRACWLAFGSEGRSEQTISTDQDNGLIFESTDPAHDRPAWLAFAREVNEALDRCGYPLCKGQIMASNPACCLTAEEWQARFESWMEHGAPEDLLKASIYFDLRPVAGRAELASPLRALIGTRAAALPRFIKQLALNALTHRPPLNWRGSIDSHKVDGHDVIDLKLQGTAIVVDVARIYALAHSIQATGTRARLEGFAAAEGVAHQESDAWVRAFEFMQSLRLQVQLSDGPEKASGAVAGHANLVDIDNLNDVDRRVLREVLRITRHLQQRLELDYQR